MLPKGLEFSAEQLERIGTCLANLRWDAEVRCVLLSDVTGQLVDVHGKAEGLNVEVLSALSAGELAATREVARLVGEGAHFRMILHEGERQSVYISPVGDELLLAVLFENSVPVGMVRIFVQGAVEALRRIAEEARAAADAAGTGQGMEVEEDDGLGWDADFGTLLAQELDISFS